MGRHIVKNSKLKTQNSKPQLEIQNFKFYLVVLPFAFCLLPFLSGCGPTYPKEKITDGILSLCKREYKITVDTKVLGGTVAVYLPVENLFDAVLSLDSKASKKINDVILGVSRVTLSTDAKFNFYIVIAQDPKVPEVEIIYIRHVEDVKRFILGGISREEYGKRALIAIKMPPQAERERILKELFAKLNIENTEELVKEYLKSEEAIAGIGDISYWGNKFFIKDILISEFLASQIEERFRTEFKQDKDLNRWFEMKGSQGKFLKAPDGNRFFFSINIANRVEPLYLESGLELEAGRKRGLAFKKVFDIVRNVLRAYRFEDFTGVEIFMLGEKKRFEKGELR